MSNIGKFLKTTRENKNLTLRKVEEITGISNAHLSQIENEKIKMPTLTILHKLAECYTVPYTHLLELTGYPNLVDNPASIKAARRVGSWVENISREEEEKLKEYLDFLRSRRG
jgi:transcriptional regulator with XRE-family HTH domain